MKPPHEIEAVPRRAARVILLDPQDRVLLIRYESDGYIFWATPGGSVESGETDREAASRELMEELQLTADLTGPVHRATSRFHHEGVYVENTDVFFCARTSTIDPPVCHAVSLFESEAMQHAQWWRLQDLEQAEEDIFPRDLAEIIVRISPLV